VSEVVASASGERQISRLFEWARDKEGAMGFYLLRRLGLAALITLGVSLLVFGELHLVPGGEARAVLGLKAKPYQIRHFDKVMGLDKPVFVQYWDWLLTILHGNLGYSYELNASVDSLIAAALPKTVLLLGLATIVTYIIGIPLGILQAVKRSSRFDHIVTAVSFTFYSLPSFWFSVLLILWFSVDLHILPSEAPQGSLVQIITHPIGLILPVLAVSLLGFAGLSRYMRSSAIESLGQDYIRFARAKGASERVVLLRHMLRNSLIPIITLFGFTLPGLIGGSVIIEEIFNYPGMGLLYYNAITSEDYPVILGIHLLVGFAVVVGNLVADLLYVLVDPRIKYTSE
jgi:peptide/nickel transport system permease protein